MYIVGGDSRFNRLAQAQMFRDANPDLELEVKTKRGIINIDYRINRFHDLSLIHHSMYLIACKAISN